MAGWLHPYYSMGFVWVHADSFLRCVASPCHSFVTTAGNYRVRVNIQLQVLTGMFWKPVSFEYSLVRRVIITKRPPIKETQDANNVQASVSNVV